MSRGNRFRGSRRSFQARNRFGYSRYGYGYPWGYAGFYDPYGWWDSGTSFDEDHARQLEIANQMDEENIEQQQQRERRDQDTYANSGPQERESAAPVETENTPSTILVFHDKGKKEVRNYAIVGTTLWNFSAQRTEKIPLGDLDLTATAKANDERGVDFRVPYSGEGQ